METEDIEECYLGKNMRRKGFVLLTPIDNEEFLRRLVNKIHHFGGTYLKMLCTGDAEKLGKREVMITCHGDFELYNLCKPLFDVCSLNSRFLDIQP